VVVGARREKEAASAPTPTLAPLRQSLDARRSLNEKKNKAKITLKRL